MKIQPDFKIKVNRDIVLKLPKIEDSYELFTLTDKNREHLREFLGWLDYSTTPEDTRNFIRDSLSKSLDLQSLNLVVYYQNSPVGFVDLQCIDYYEHSATIGYWLDKDHEGKGIITQSIRALIDYAFQQLKLHRLGILCATHNLRSQQIALRLGFTYEGTLKEAIAHYGTFFDAHLYGLINHYPKNS